jgi:hypothetical protein
MSLGGPVTAPNSPYGDQPTSGYPGNQYPGPPPTYAGGPAYGPPAPGYQPYPPQPSYNIYAILSLVFAIFILPPLGIYFGIKAQQQIAVSGERGVELAKAGVVTGWVLSGFYVLSLLITCGLFLGMFGVMGSIFVNTPH